MFFLVLGVLMVVLVGVVAVITMAAGRLKRAKEGKFNGQVITIAGGLINALFMMSLVFLAATAWQNSAQARVRTFTEAGAMVEINSLSSPLPQEKRDRLHSLTRDYLTQVSTDEWRLMESGQRSQQAAGLLTSIRSEVLGISVTGDTVKTVRDRMLDRVRDASDARRMRISDAATAPSRYLLLQLGLSGLLVVGFPLLVGFSPDPRHIALVCAITFGVVACILVAVDLSRPFAGVERITPDAYTLALEQIG
ncbi:DUF4239 domain-containing protein [Pseudonocardiaceae bacterium YIM PH 21723]|nr:DUF4239 domain-containing protein [Pseudonocardiaceae bacterium YIM PH 21723]